jgi:hypothetical protein
MRLLLSATVLVSFSIRYIAILRHQASLGDGRIGPVILAAILLYGGLLLASIDKISYLSVGASAAALLVVCSALEAMLQSLAKRTSRRAANNATIRYYG